MSIPPHMLSIIKTAANKMGFGFPRVRFLFKGYCDGPFVEFHSALHELCHFYTLPKDIQKEIQTKELPVFSMTVAIESLPPVHKMFNEYQARFCQWVVTRALIDPNLAFKDIVILSDPESQIPPHIRKDRIKIENGEPIFSLILYSQIKDIMNILLWSSQHQRKKNKVGIYSYMELHLNGQMIERREIRGITWPLLAFNLSLDSPNDEAIPLHQTIWLDGADLELIRETLEGRRLRMLQELNEIKPSLKTNRTGKVDDKHEKLTRCIEHYKNIENEVKEIITHYQSHGTATVSFVYEA